MLAMSRFSTTTVPRDRTFLTTGERVGEIVGIVIITLIASYFVNLQVSNSGFMTSKFGALEAVLFYGSFAVAILSSAARAIIGRRDRARPFEIVSNVFTAVAALWFLSLFPFDFSHVVDPFPYFVRNLFSWNPNIFGWAIILLVALATIAAAVYNSAKLILDML